MALKGVVCALSMVHLTLAVNLGIYDCPAPWVEFDGSCYKFQAFPSPIATAKADCASDGAALVKVYDGNVNNFIIQQLTLTAKDGLSWFTSGITDLTSTGAVQNTGYTWESDGSAITGSQFWFNDNCRANLGNRITYYTDGSTWGWCLVNETSVNLPYICQISKHYIYKIVNVKRGFDFGMAEINPVQLPAGPSFTVEPVSVIYDTGSTQKLVVFNCEVTANPLPSYVWYVYRNQVRSLVNLTDQSKTVTNGRLSILAPSQLVDNGEYQCQASNAFGSILSYSATLGFGFLNDFPKSQRDSVKAVAYQGVPIQCIPPTSGYSTLSYTWFKESTLNMIRTSVKWYIFVSSDGTLYFQSVTKDDNGNYFCMVTRPNSKDNFQEGKVSMPIPLQVSDSAGNQQEPQIVNSFPKAFPTSPRVGDNLRLECVAWGTETLQYSWTRIGADMPTGAVFSDYNRVLSINNVQLQHSGTYRCLVSRQRGTGTQGDVTITIEAVPFFTIPIEDQLVDLGTTASFRCYASGVPSVTYSWYINSTLFNVNKIPAADRNRYTISNNILTISNVQPYDSGMYQCAATNTHGTIYCSAELRTYAFPPSFDKYPLHPNMYAIIDGNVTLLCQPEAAPAPTKQWYFNGYEFNPGTDQSQRVVLLPNGNIHITGVQTTDAGLYSCIATNDYGSANTSGLLTVLPSTDFAYAPRDAVVMVNQTAFIPCVARYNPVIDIRYDWWHNNYKIMFIKVVSTGNDLNSVHIWRESHYERGTGINRGGLYIRNTQFYHAGQYKCVMVSSSDQIAQTAFLTVIGPPGEPAGVYGYNARATSIELTFWPSKNNGRPVLYYIVEIYNMLEKFWYRNPSSINIPAPTDTSVQIKANVTELNPYTQYMFRAIGVNVLGEGKASQPSVLYRTTEAPPITYPRNLGGGGGKVGTVNITWEPMPVSEWNAGKNAVGYVVYWKKQEMDETQWDHAVINDPTALKHVVTVGSQNYYLPYNVKIQAFNPQGYGPMSPVVTIMSAEDIPKGVPISVRAVYYNATAIIVEWKPVENSREVMHGVLLGYRINYWIDVEQNESMALFKVIHNQTDHGMIIALRENTFYMINVQAINTAGNGPKSENYRTRTLRAAPIEAPQDVRVSVVDYQSVLIQWRGVYTTIIEEPLEGYTVRHWLRGENIYVASNVDAGKQIRYVLGNLKQQTMYELRVFGYSRGGDGLQSSPAVEFVLGSNCDIQEDSPDKEYVYTCRGCQLRSSQLLLISAIVWFITRILHPV